MSLGRIGCVGRFKPVHLGAEAMLEAICENADHAFIGIGSSNKYNLRNPFTAEETSEMVHLVLDPRFSNYEIIPVQDKAHLPEHRDGQAWKNQILDLFGPLDYFITGNDYVKSLLEPHYRIIHPASIILPEKQLPLRGTEVRIEMARGEGWETLVPKEVAGYLKDHHLIDRFRKEFGLQSLIELIEGRYKSPENRDEEMFHTYEG